MMHFRFFYGMTNYDKNPRVNEISLCLTMIHIYCNSH